MAYVKISEMNKHVSEYPKDTIFIWDEPRPRYILDPFEIIRPDDPRYDSALTREEVNKINEEYKKAEEYKDK